MTQSCTVCLKGSKKSASRSHSKIKTLRRQKVNLQKLDGKMVCTRCIRTKARRPSLRSGVSGQANKAK